MLKKSTAVFVSSYQSQIINLIYQFSRCLTLTLISLSFVFSLYAENLLPGGPTFTHKNMLGQHKLGLVTKIYYGNNGYIWLGTIKGLVRYDGNGVKSFVSNNKVANSLSHNDIWDIAEDAQQNLWIATFGGGVNLFDMKTETFHYIGKEHGLPSNTVFSIYTAKNGRVWVGTKKGLAFISPKSMKVTLFNRLDVKSVWDIFEDSQQRLWVGTSSGLYLIDQEDNLTHFSNKKNAPYSLSNNTVRTIYEDVKGQIWIGTDHGLNLYQNNGFKHFVYDANDLASISGNEIHSIFQDSWGQLWIGTLNRGLNLFKEQSQEFIRYAKDLPATENFPESSIYSMVEDRSGVVWATTDKGIVNWRLSDKRFNHFLFTGNQSERINNLAINSKGYWAISDSKLFNYVDQQVIETASFTQHSPLTAITSTDNNIWIGSFRSGLLHYSPSSKKITQFKSMESVEGALPSNVVSCLLLDKSQTLWVGMYQPTTKKPGGMAKFDLETNKFISYLPNQSITSIVELNDNTLVIGTYYDGLLLFDKSSGQTETINLGGNSNNFIRTLFLENENTLWIGTEGSGLGVIDIPSKTVSFIEGSDQVASNINSITSNGHGNIWLGTINGLVKYTKEDKTFSLFDGSAGIKLSDFSNGGAYSTKTGELIFAGGGGILQFKPNDIVKSQFSPPVVINEFKLLNKRVEIGEQLSASIEHIETLTLSHDDYLFSLTFSALDFTSPEKNIYAYMMEGLHSDWVYTDAFNRVATFTTLAPGKYRLRVKSSNSDGHWSNNETSLNIEIQPPWWRHWLAYLIYTISCLLAMFAFIHFRTRALKLRTKDLEIGVQERTLALEQKTNAISVLLEQKQHMFTNISHEFRTPLTLILSPIEQLLKENNSQQQTATLISIKRNCQRLLSMVDQLLELARLGSPTKTKAKLYSLKNTILLTVASFEPLAANKQQNLILNPIDNVTLKMQPDSLERILGNLLSNAIKYTDEGGQIEITTKQIKSDVIISIKDTGCGIPKCYQQEIFEHFYRGAFEHNEQIPGAGIGLSLVKELVKLHLGEITLVSQEGIGSTFSVHIPIYQGQYTEQDISTSTPHKNLWLVPEATENKTQVSKKLTNLDADLPLLLIIEDNTEMREHLINLLCKDYLCIQAVNGEEGLAQAKLYVPDIIICDVMMPKINGYQLSEELKHDQALSHIPIVLLTARADIESRLEGWRKNIDDYLTKPFVDDELKLKLESLLTIRAILRTRFVSEMKNSPENLTKIKRELNDKDQQFIAEFEVIVEENHSNIEFQLPFVAKELCMSDRQLIRKLKAIMGLSFTEYVRSFRLRKSLTLLQESMPVTQVIEKVGFSSPSYFSNCFKAEYSETPKQFQQRCISKQRSNQIAESHTPF